jgi:ankyrin repeat protein
MGIAHRVVLTQTPEQAIAFFRREANLLDDKHEKSGTPLMVCLDADREELARTLIELGADVNATDLYGRTPLMIAARQGLTESVKLLVKVGADVNTRDAADGWTAMDWAGFRKHHEVAAVLKQAGGVAAFLDDDADGV